MAGLITISRQFWRRLGVFLGVMLTLYVLFIALSSRYVPRIYDINYRTHEAVLPNIRKGHHTSYLFMGNSHGRQFHRAKSKAITDHVMGKPTMSIAKRAADLLAQQIFLEEYYAEGNHADTVLCFFDPYLLFRTYWGRHPKMYNDEPLRGRMAWRMAREGVDASTILEYINHPVQLRWLITRPTDYSRLNDSLDRRDPLKVAARVYSLYPGGTADTTTAIHIACRKRLHRLVNTVRSHNGTCVLILPPHLLGNTPGRTKVMPWLKAFARQKHVHLLDHHATVPQPERYLDHDHLNYAGIRFYLSRILQPALTQLQQPDPQ